MKFVILLEKCAANAEFAQVVPAHVAYMDELHARGILVAGGPFLDSRGGMIIVDVADEAEAHAVAKEDPFIACGVERYTLRSWEVLTPTRPALLTRDG